MKDRTFIKILMLALVMFIALSVYQLMLINNLRSNLEEISKNRDWVIEKYNEKEKEK